MAVVEKSEKKCTCKNIGKIFLKYTLLEKLVLNEI